MGRREKGKGLVPWENFSWQGLIKYPPWDNTDSVALEKNPLPVV